MALSEEDRKETVELMSDAFALGIQKFRSAEEEALAKQQQDKKPDDKGDSSGSDNGGTNPFSLAGFFLGAK